MYYYSKFSSVFGIIFILMLDVEHLIQSGGILLVAFIVFAESGLLVGFFLPGDTLLFTAGFFASQGSLNLPLLIVAIVTAAIVGDNVGYSIGRRTGHRIFKKEDGIFFHKDNIKRAEAFYDAHGGKTIVLARFVPVVRTFVPVIAGVGKMPRKTFFFYNIIGAIIWGAGVTLLGYWLGSKIDNVEKYILPVFLLATLATFGPALYHLLKDKENRDRIAKKFKFWLSNLFLNKRVK